MLRAQPEARALFVSPELLEELSIPDQTKFFVRVLRHPVTGCLVYLIGTVHVTASCANDVRVLIKGVEPDLVAVEVRHLATERLFFT